MVIKKVLKFIKNKSKKGLKSEASAINRVQSKSTLFGREKVIALKKIGRIKRKDY